MFANRTHAGNLLAEKLSSYRGKNALLIGLARGGVVTAAAVAEALHLPLDVLVVKKIGAPGESELAVGALAPDGVSFIDWRFAQMLGAEERSITSQITALNDLIRQRTLLYRKGKKPYAFRERTVIVVDDGAATGATMEAAVRWLRKKHAKEVVVALPVAPREVSARLAPETDALVILETPENFSAVGQFYEDFAQVGDGDVVALLRRTSETHPAVHHSKGENV